MSIQLTASASTNWIQYATSSVNSGATLTPQTLQRQVEYYSRYRNTKWYRWPPPIPTLPSVENYTID